MPSTFTSRKLIWYVSPKFMVLKGGVLERSSVNDNVDPLEQLFVTEAKGPPLEAGRGNQPVDWDGISNSKLVFVTSQVAPTGIFERSDKLSIRKLWPVSLNALKFEINEVTFGTATEQPVVIRAKLIKKRMALDRRPTWVLSEFLSYGLSVRLETRFRIFRTKVGRDENPLFGVAPKS